MRALNSEQRDKLNAAILLIGVTKLHDSEFNASTLFGPETQRSDRPVAVATRQAQTAQYPSSPGRSG